MGRTRRDLGVAGRARTAARRRPERGQAPAGPAFPELFSGCGRLTSAMADAGLRVGPPFELSAGRRYDVCSREAGRTSRRWLIEGRLWLVAFGTPCSGWSMARGTAPTAERVGRHGLACARAIVRLLRLCHRLGVRVLLENPAGSQLWRWPPLAKELRTGRLVTVRVDMCSYDAAWKKPTRFETNLAGA